MSSLPGSRVPSHFGPAAHFTEYAVLAGLTYRALRLSHGRRASMLTAIALASAYAISDEFHQYFVPMRTPDPVDWLVDTVGAAVGATTTALAFRDRSNPRNG